MKKDYHTRLKELREDHDMTQAQVAEILGIKRQQYARYEANTRMPIEYLIPLCQYYKVSSDYILGIRF